LALVAKTKGSDEWKAITSAISSLVDEATFAATSEGISFRGMDPSHIALIDILWPNSAFERFECDGETNFGVRMDEFSKVIKKADKNDSIELNIKSPENMQVVIISKGYKKEYKMRLIETTAGSTPLPKIDFKAKIVLSVNLLEKILSDIQVVSDKISIKSSADKVSFEGIGDAGEVVITPESTSDANAEGLRELDVKEESKASYSLEHLSKIVKDIGSSADYVACEYSSKVPLRLEFKFAKVGTIHFYLAPRMDD
jgi:proliferating cell nuclear antigen